jgi:CRISPR-associated protein Cmr1
MEPEILTEEEVGYKLSACTHEWMEGFDKDYPNCLGRDEKGALLWKTKPMPAWEYAMRELADAYVGVRAKKIGDIGKLDPDGSDFPGERHLLGFPLTNHPAKKTKNWGNQGRHGSPLRFILRKKGEGYQGYVLHLPHEFSEQMNPMPKERQIEVWKKVHRKLDYTFDRAKYEECL